MNRQLKLYNALGIELVGWYTHYEPDGTPCWMCIGQVVSPLWTWWSSMLDVYWSCGIPTMNLTVLHVGCVLIMWYLHYEPDGPPCWMCIVSDGIPTMNLTVLHVGCVLCQVVSPLWTCRSSMLDVYCVRWYPHYEPDGPPCWMCIGQVVWTWQLLWQYINWPPCITCAKWNVKTFYIFSFVSWHEILCKHP